MRSTFWKMVTWMSSIMEFLFEAHAFRDDFSMERGSSNAEYCLEENDSNGVSRLTVHIAGRSLCLQHVDAHPVCGLWQKDKTMGWTKNVDHCIFEQAANGWILHMVEMKTSVGRRTWQESIKPKFRSSYLNMRALAAILDIPIVETRTYTTYLNDKFEMEAVANPRIAHPYLGDLQRNPFTEWRSDRVAVNLGSRVLFPHRRIKMAKKDACLVGEVRF